MNDLMMKNDTSRIYLDEDQLITVGRFYKKNVEGGRLGMVLGQFFQSHCAIMYVPPNVADELNEVMAKHGYTTKGKTIVG